jgi:hypothetical protein
MSMQDMPAEHVRMLSRSGSVVRRLMGACRTIPCFVVWLLAAKDELPRDWGPLPDAPHPRSFPNWTSAQPD